VRQAGPEPQAAPEPRSRPRVLLTGRTGQVGGELLGRLEPFAEVVAPDRSRLDLRDARAIRREVEALRPALIVNAAAYTAVDQAESEPEVAAAVNEVAPGVLAEAARAAGAALVHYSTDYVFGGERASPYAEDDAPAPLQVYGRTKLAGERAVEASGAAHLIFRTSWVYGLRGRSFFTTVSAKLRAGEDLRVVDDQTGTPTWSRTVAEVTARILVPMFFAAGGPRAAIERVAGIYHLSAAGETTWYGFACAIAAGLGLDPARRIAPVSTSERPLPARRPAYSVLSKEKLLRVFDIEPPRWEEDLERLLRA
jgi:dTDP-4-dehydrorhamnose reductase